MRITSSFTAFITHVRLQAGAQTAVVVLVQLYGEGNNAILDNGVTLLTVPSSFRCLS